jgi:hypothetical protein
MAMKGNEQLTNAKYGAAEELQDLPDSAKQVIRRNHQDEVRHLEWIRKALDQKIWDQAQPSAG